MDEDVVLRMFTIYRRPSDFPGVEFLVRRMDIGPSGHGEPVHGPVIGTAATIEDARSLVSDWAGVCQSRGPEDDPVIVETWF
jgi:hypothetical protein